MATAAALFFRSVSAVDESDRMTCLILMFDPERIRTRFVHLPGEKAPASIKTRIGDFVVILEGEFADDNAPPLPE